MTEHERVIGTTGPAGPAGPAGIAGIVGILGTRSRALDIATACLAAGWQVRLGEAVATATADTRAAMEASLAASARDAGAASGARAGLVDRPCDVAVGASIVIVSLGDDPDQSGRVFRELDAAAAPDTILATDTDRLSVEACARATRHPERVIGLHFVPTVRPPALVEVVVTGQTSLATLEAAVGFAASLRARSVICADSPGFIVDRVGRAYLLEAVRVLEAGRGTVVGIDAALETAGYACGPLRLIDRMGLDVDLAIDAALYEAFDGAARFRPPALQRDLVDQGRLGRAHGRGFYRYAADGSAIPDLDLEVVQALSDEEIVERLELAVINEAYRAVHEQVASPPDVDLAMRLGLGHPRGPFERVDQLGLRLIVERLRVLHAMTLADSGDQYEVAPALWQMATV